MVDPHPRHLLGAGDPVGDADEVNGDLDVVLAARPDGVPDGLVIGGAEDVDHVGASLGRHLHLVGTRVHDLHVGHYRPSGEGPLQLPHGLHALALDEGRASLQPVGAALDGLSGDLHGPLEMHHVQGHLKYGSVHHGITLRGLTCLAT